MNNKKNMFHHKTRKGIWEEFLLVYIPCFSNYSQYISYIEIKPLLTFYTIVYHWFLIDGGKQGAFRVTYDLRPVLRPLD